MEPVADRFADSGKCKGAVALFRGLKRKFAESISRLDAATVISTHKADRRIGNMLQ